MYRIKNILPDIKPRVIGLPKINVGCEFRAEKYKADGTITYRGPWFKNTVLNVGLDQLALARHVFPISQSASAIRYLNVGTGSTEPAVAQTGLTTWLASTTSFYGDISWDYSVGDVGTSAPCWKSGQRTFAFAIGGCTGNLTELGLSNASNSSYYNRQLFRDGIGDPTVITVAADEGLRVTVKSSMYSTLAVDGTADGTFLLDSVSTAATTTQLGGVWLTGTTTTSYNMPGYIGSATGGNAFARIATDTGSFVGATSVNVATYTSGNFYRDVTLKWSPGTFVGDWKRLDTRFYYTDALAGGSPFRVVLTTAETIADTQEITITLRRSWGRV